MSFYDWEDKRYAVYMISYRMWRGTINYNQKPRFASSNLDEVVCHADNLLINSCNGTAYAIVDYMYNTILTVKVKEDNQIYIQH